MKERPHIQRHLSNPTIADFAQFLGTAPDRNRPHLIKERFHVKAASQPPLLVRFEERDGVSHMLHESMEPQQVVLVASAVKGEKRVVVLRTKDPRTNTHTNWKVNLEG